MGGYFPQSVQRRTDVVMRKKMDARDIMVLSCRVESLMERVDKLEDGSVKNVLSSSEAADYLGVSQKKLYSLIQRNGLPFFKPSRKLLFERRNLDDWVRENVHTISHYKFL